MMECPSGLSSNSGSTVIISILILVYLFWCKGSLKSGKMEGGS